MTKRLDILVYRCNDCPYLRNPRKPDGRRLCVARAIIEIKKTDEIHEKCPLNDYKPTSQGDTP